MTIVRFRLLVPIALLLVFLLPTTTMAASPARVVTHGSRSVKTVALTFDDGWGTANCQKVVNILEDTHTPATFLPNAKWVQAAPDFWTSVVKLGFPIANHTTHHPLLTKLGYTAQYKEINSDRKIIERITGVTMTRVLRPPFGAYDATTRQAAADAGFPIVMNWDTTFADSSRQKDGSLWPLSKYLHIVIKGTNGSIILGHCGASVEYQILRKVIANYRARGFTFVTVPQILGLSGAKPMKF